jgi:PAS domain S-box-containing protein
MKSSVKSSGQPNIPPSGRRPEVKIVVVYLVFAGLWILLSDTALTFLTQDPSQLNRWQTYKGSGFVIITGLLLYFMLRRAFAGTSAVERSLRDSEFRLRRFFEDLSRTKDRLDNAQRIARMGNWDWEVKEQKLFWSDEIYRIFGMEKGKDFPTGDKFLEAVPIADRDWVKRVHEQALQTGKPLDYEYRICRRDGQVRWVREKAEIIFNDQAQAVRISGTIQDITERKRALEAVQESEQRLRALTAHVESLREEERRRISREIHDELGQMLTALKMELRWLEKQLAEHELAPSLNPLLDRVVFATELVDGTITAVQRISAELRPGILDNLGLVPALQYEATRFKERTGIQCELTVPEVVPEIPPAISTALYRIFQECLTNVTRHAKATRIEAHFRFEDGKFLLRMQDDGVGMNMEELANPRSLGLLGMQERAMLLGGRIVFENPERGGTAVRVCIPLVFGES